MHQVPKSKEIPERSKGEPLARALAEAHFTRLYRDYSREVLAYSLSRTSRPEDAADVVAETFLVAWRRAAEVPPSPEACLWLFGVARRVLANQRRGDGRRTRLSEHLQAELPAAASVRTEPDGAAATVMSALARLGEEDREVLLLAGWEELRSAEIAKVLGISTVAARTRLHRARRRLRKELAVKGDGRLVPAPVNLELEDA